MSRKANPTLIGIFLFAGLLLAVAGLLLFTSSKIFTKTGSFIVYFDTTLSGLNEGAPVKYRGVTIGSVTRVLIHYNQATNDSAMPVIFEVQQDLVGKKLVGPTTFKNVNPLDERNPKRAARQFGNREPRHRRALHRILKARRRRLRLSIINWGQAISKYLHGRQRYSSS